MALVGVDAQNSAELPRLVVNILVDQLRTDYMEAFAPLYGEDGFKRLMAEARFYTDAQQPFYRVDRASAAATLSTGTSPSCNGIPSLSWMSRETLQPIFCVDDARQKGLQTTDRTSPQRLLTTTLTDELELATGKKSIVYSIAPEREVAVLMAGHLADGAFWINDDTGSWCGTDYYGAQYPAWAAVYERSTPLSSRIKKMTYESVYEGALQDFHYFQSLNDTEQKDFKHKFEGNHRYRLFKNSALVNEEVVKFVDRCLEGSYIARDRVPDILNVGLYAGNFDHRSVTVAPSELQDTYVRLDLALAHLMASVEKIVGTNGALFVVSSTGYADSDDDGQRLDKIPTGTFSMQRSSMLLNMYLSAIFGQAQYVVATYDNQIYLDHKLIEQQQLRLADLLARSEEFLAQMAGVRQVYTSQSLVLSSWEPRVSRIRAGWNAACSGDILVEVNPGWTITYEHNPDYTPPSEAYLSFPLFFLGADIATERITTPVTTAAVAPTIACCLRIRAPNGSSEAPLVLK